MSYKAYYSELVSGGAVIANITNWAAHWLYGTSAATLTNLSHRGIVPNPPGH